jgi:hypothetical protein
MAESADTGLTVVIASHVVSELARLCDWLLVLAGGRHSTVLIRTDPARRDEPRLRGWQSGPVSFEQLVLAYLQRPPAATAADLVPAGLTAREAAR